MLKTCIEQSQNDEEDRQVLKQTGIGVLLVYVFTRVHSYTSANVINLMPRDSIACLMDGSVNILSSLSRWKL